MVERLLIWLMIVAILVALCWFRPQAARVMLGIFFIVMGIGYHIVLVLLDRHVYDGFATTALLPLYRWVFATFVQQMPLIFGFTAGIFEVAIGMLMLVRGRFATYGFVAGSLFLLAITPLGMETLPNALLACGCVLLARQPFPASVWTQLRLVR